MHARVISETDARKGLLGHWYAQPERPFWRMHATDFWASDARKAWGKSRMRATYIPDAGNPSNRSFLPSVPSSFLRRIQSFHTSTERSKLFKLSRCLLSADSGLSPCQSTSSKYCCISCRCLCDSPCTTTIDTWTLRLPFDVAHILITCGITTNAFSL